MRSRWRTESFRAWEQTTGTNGGTADTSINGTTTAFSSATDTESLVINPVNDAPVMNNSGNMTLTSITEIQTTNSGNTVASIISIVGGGGSTRPKPLPSTSTTSMSLMRRIQQTRTQQTTPLTKTPPSARQLESPQHLLMPMQPRMQFPTRCLTMPVVDEINTITIESMVLNTVVGTGLQLWVVQGAQLAATLISVASAWIEIDPLSVMQSAIDEKRKKRGDERRRKTV